MCKDNVFLFKMIIFAALFTTTMVYKYDFLVIGAGVAGMSYALKIARANKGKVCIICKTTLDEANTFFAQGGVASVTNLKVDTFDKHIADTIIAGDYISDRKAVEQVVRNAPSQIEELVNWGVNFDKKDDGQFDLHREGGHSEFRILHHADDTGAEIQRGLMEAVRNNPNIEVKENHFAVEIITQHHLGVRITRRSPHIQCYGAYVLNPKKPKVDTYLAKVTVMCTGGCGAVYLTTSNPVIATGDGIAMVYRAKGTVADMEFVQFHPTVLHNPNETHPAYLITEAMRGYGGILKLPNGETFMEKYDERLSLAPRDIVARAIDKEMKIHGIDHVCLDVTHKPAEETVSISLLITSPSVLLPTICAEVSRLTSTDSRASKDSMPSANVHAQDCMAATVWPLTHSSRRWSMRMLLPNTRFSILTNTTTTLKCPNGMTKGL